MLRNIKQIRTKSVPIILIFVGVVFWACKNRDPEKSSTEIKNIVEVEENHPELDSEFAKFLDRIENFILTEYLDERDLRRLSKDERKFQIHQIDLNNDGEKEIFINFTSSYFCEEKGCSVLLLNDKLKLITEFTLTQTPIYVEDTLENDWRSIMVRSKGKWRRLIYKDGSYPSNPSDVEISKDAPAKTATLLFDKDNKDLRTYSF